MSAQANEHELSIPGRDVPVRVWGAEELPPLVLLHGLFGNAAEWDTVAERLSRSRRVIVPDQRGHGYAAWATDYTAARLVGDVVDLVDKLELGSFDLVGHSMGGIVSLLYAASHPDRVRSLSLIDIGPETLANSDVRDGVLEMLAEAGRATYVSVDQVVEQWIDGDPLARPLETERWAGRGLAEGDDGGFRWRTDVAGIGQFLRSAPTPAQLWAAADAVTSPALVVHGEQSWALDKSSAHELADRLGECHVVDIRGCGHDLGVQAPEIVADHIAAFVNGGVEAVA